MTADCNAPDGSVSHYIVSVKNPPPVMRLFVKIAGPFVFVIMLSFMVK